MSSQSTLDRMILPLALMASGALAWLSGQPVVTAGLGLAALVIAAVRLKGQRHVLVLIALVLSTKLFMALDLIFALIEARPMRYVYAQGVLTQNLRLTALGVLLLWMASFVAGTRLSAPNVTAYAVDVRFSGYTKAAILVLAFVSQLAFVALLLHVGGIERMLSGMASRYEMYHGVGFLRVLVGLGAICSALGILRGARRWPWGFALLVAIELAALGGRSFAVFSTLVPLILLSSLRRGFLKPRHLASVGILGIAFAYGVGEYRVAQLSSRYASFENPVRQLAYDTGAAENFPAVLHLLETDQTGFDGGKIVLSSLVAPVPRIVWPGKPMVDDAAVVAQLLLPEVDEVNWGLPLGPHGLAFFTGGYLAVPIFGLFAGGLFGLLLRLRTRDLGLAAVTPFLLVLVPDVFSPAVFARAVVLATCGLVLALLNRVRT